MMARHVRLKAMAKNLVRVLSPQHADAYYLTKGGGPTPQNGAREERGRHVSHASAHQPPQRHSR
jgi:hypothetical protein